MSPIATDIINTTLSIWLAGTFPAQVSVPEAEVGELPAVPEQVAQAFGGAGTMKVLIEVAAAVPTLVSELIGAAGRLG